MYSLYRAWFGGEGCSPLETRTIGPVGPAVGLSPPDTLIRVGNDGEHQFVAHRSVLSAHSGYLKALLATASNITSNAGTNTSVASLSVSSVGGEAFAPLLNYMYTGRLEVTLDNIYSVLLATHLLHMPGALEQCRAALLKLRSPPSGSGILRPVPSRVVGPPLCWPPPSIYSTGVLPLPSLSVPTTISLSRMSTPISRETHPINTTNYNVKEKSISPKPSTSQQRSRSPARLSSPDSSRRNDTGTTTRGRRSPSPGESSEQISVTDSEPFGNKKIQNTINEPGNSSSGVGSTVVIDIACCDGPVRFHRVLNANYSGININDQMNPVGQQQQQQQQQQQRVCDIETIVENDENVCDDETGDGNLRVSELASNNPNETGHYTCGYCRHTFKSQYCYQKHARRHLHPSNNDGQTGSSSSSISRRREVRLLDLNVQYYPCKICGSKFPSYYFVHKHRKLCHGTEDNQSGSDEANVSNSSNPQI